MSKFHFVLVVALSAISFSASAGETVNRIIHQHYIAPRAMGMGNTFSGIDDYNVMFYNPAGLASLEEGRMNIGIGGAISKDFLDFGKDIQDLSDIPESDATKNQQIADFLSSKYGETYAARIPRMNFIYTRPKWGIALIPVDLSLYMSPHQIVGPMLDVTAYQDTTLAFGWAKKTANKKFSWGFLGKAIYRANVDKSFLAVDLANDGDIIRDQDYKEGMTVDADAGVQWSPYLNRNKGFFRKLKPTFSAVLRNIADYGFTSNFEIFNENSTEPEKLGRRLDLGSRWDFTKWSVFEPRLMIDVRDIGHDYWTLEKGLHLGAEIKYNVGKGLYGSFQGGMSQMLWTAGFGIQTYLLKLEVTSYAEEVGTSSEKLSNRVYLAQVNFNW